MEALRDAFAATRITAADLPATVDYGQARSQFGFVRGMAGALLSGLVTYPELQMIFAHGLKAVDLGSGTGDFSLDLLIASELTGSEGDIYGIDGFVGYPERVTTALTQTLEPLRYRHAIIGSSHASESPFTPSATERLFFQESAFHFVFSLSGPIQYQLRALRVRVFKELTGVDLTSVIEDPERLSAALMQYMRSGRLRPQSKLNLAKLQAGNPNELGKLLDFAEGKTLDRMFSEARRLMVVGGLMIVAPRHRGADSLLEPVVRSDALLNFFAYRNLLYPLNPPAPYSNEDLTRNLDAALDLLWQVDTQRALGDRATVNFPPFWKEMGSYCLDWLSSGFGGAPFSRLRPQLRETFVTSTGLMQRSMFRAVTAQERDQRGRP